MYAVPTVLQASAHQKRIQKLHPSPSAYIKYNSALLVFLQSGNRAYQAGEYKKAYKAYSEALQLEVKDATFRAVLHCNRAAALHGLGCYLDAIADCYAAAHLDASYPRVLQVCERGSIVHTSFESTWLLKYICRSAPRGHGFMLRDKLVRMSLSVSSGVCLCDRQSI